MRVLYVWLSSTYAQRVARYLLISSYRSENLSEKMREAAVQAFNGTQQTAVVVVATRQFLVGCSDAVFLVLCLFAWCQGTCGWGATRTDQSECVLCVDSTAWEPVFAFSWILTWCSTRFLRSWARSAKKRARHLPWNAVPAVPCWWHR